jgi:DNA-binding CsgD family transcriptional regulator
MGRGIRRVAPPRGLAVDAFTAAGEEFLIFSWEHEPPSRPGVALTAAERDVLERVVRGDSNADIARVRKASVRTVANQVASLLRKTGAESRFDLIRRFSGARG